MPIPAAAAIGAYGSADHTARQVLQVNEKIVATLPRENLFYAVMSMSAKAEPVEAITHTWQYVDPWPRKVTLTAGVTSSGTNFTVDSNLILTEDLILLAPNGEQILVKTPRSSGTTQFVSYTRGIAGGTAPAPIASGAELRILSVARVEGSSRGTPASILPEQDSNNYQQVEMNSAYTDIQRMVKHYGQSVPEFQMEQMILEYKTRLEAMLLFQRKARPTSTQLGTSYPGSICAGVEHYIRAAGQHVHNVGEFTWPEFDDYMAEAAIYSRNRVYWAWGSTSVLNIMNRWPMQWNNGMDATTKTLFGLKIKGFVGANYTVYLGHSYQFEHAPYRDQLFVLDMDSVEHLIGMNMPDTMNKEVSGPKKDGNHLIVDQMTGVHSGRFQNPLAHLIFTGITG